MSEVIFPDKIIFVQPLIPSYRDSFFKELRKRLNFDLYVYFSESYLRKNNFGLSIQPTRYIANIHIGNALILNVFSLIFGSHKIIVLCAEMKIVTNWLVLILARFAGKKVVLWGHGLDARFYNEQLKKMPFLRRLMYQLSDGAWFYTKNEQNIWKNILPSLKSIALGNTADVPYNQIPSSVSKKRSLKAEYGINTDFNFIFCARFNCLHRRNDLLVQFIERLDKTRFGFIIIGEGYLKPDFSKYKNVYDFGELYDRKTKSDLFTVADAYFQPAWCGLSIVEAMAYGKPVLTFKRSKDIMQCVEYGYIQHGFNGLLFENMDELLDYVTQCRKDVLDQIGLHAKQYVKGHLTIENMVDNAVKGILMLEENQ